jgi:hypothetical protein
MRLHAIRAASRLFAAALWLSLCIPRSSAAAQEVGANPVAACPYLSSEVCRDQRLATLAAERRALIRARRTPRYHRVRASGFSLIGLGAASVLVGALLVIGDSDLGENGHQSGAATTVGFVLLASAPGLILLGGAMALAAKLRTTRQPAVLEINREMRRVKAARPAKLSIIPVIPSAPEAPWGLSVRGMF